MRGKRALSVCAALLLVALSRPSGAHTWRTIETTHFRVHAPDTLMDAALRAATIAERAYDPLTRLFDWIPGGPIDIVVADTSDRANGHATVVPRNFIYAEVAPPETLSSVNDFDDWLALLVIHELTHVVHLDVTLGANRILNFLSGKIVAPNQAQPDWLIEGMAVLAESAGTRGGRGQSRLFDMLLRMATLEGKLHRLDRVSHRPLTFPYATTAYVYGASFLAYVRDRYGVDKMKEIAHRYGERLIPFGVNRVAILSLGKGYDELWEEWKDSLGRRYRLQAEEIARAGLTPTTRLTFDGEGWAGSMSPRFLPDGRVVYQRNISRERPALVSLDVATRARTTLFAAEGLGSAAPAPDGRSLFVSRTRFDVLPRREFGESHQAAQGLFRFDLKTKTFAAVTNGEKARHPAVSPDGRWVTFVRTQGNTTSLMTVSTVSGAARTLVAGNGREAFYTPTISPDGNQLAYVRTNPTGSRALHIYDRAREENRALPHDVAIASDPVFTADGRHLLFSSDRSGVYNIYALDLLTDRLAQVTNVLGGAFQPTLSPDGNTLVFVGFGADGFDLHAMPFEPERWVDAPAPVPRMSGNDEMDTLFSSAHVQIDPIETRVGPYQGWRHLYPRRWDLTMASDPLGLGPTGTITTRVDDPARIHSATLSVAVPPDGDASVYTEYTYQRFYPALTLWGFRTAQRVSERQQMLGGGSQIELPFWRDVNGSLDLALGYSRRWVSFAGASAYASLQFDNARSWNHSIAPQEGRRFGATIDHGAPWLGQSLSTTTVGWNWTEYFTAPWANLQTFAVGYHGGRSVGSDQKTFALGGFVEEDALRALFSRRTQCCQFLRGYSAGSVLGNQFHLLSTEFRVPLLWIERGHATFPGYLRRLSGAIFVDAGQATSNGFDWGATRWGVGGELRLSFTFGYRRESQLSAGMARGLSDGGITDFYVAAAIPF